MNDKNTPFRIFTIGVFIILIVPVLIQDGMFVDGQQYACVAKNLAHGIGTFWQPVVSATWMKSGSGSFLEHPPLVYGIQSVFFLVFGDSMYVERFYSLLTAVISALLISLIWKILFAENVKLKKLSWLPVLFWIIIPVCFWSYQNDMQENTMGIFTLASVYFSIRALHLKKNIYFNLILSGIAVFAATLCKGAPGLFPLGAVGLYWLLNRDFSFAKMLLYTFILVSIPVVIYACLMLNNDAYESLTFYFNKRLLYRIHDEPTVSNRFHIIYKLVTEMLPVIIISYLFNRYAKLKLPHIKQSSTYNKLITLFFLIGMCGSLPIALTLVQSGFYFVPSLPFFAIGFALFIAPEAALLVDRLEVKGKIFNSLKIFSIAVLLAGIIFSISRIGKKGRDSDLLTDVYIFGKIIPSNNIVTVDESVYQGNWSMQFYLIRHFNISEETPNGVQRRYYIKDKDPNKTESGNYKKLPLPTKMYDLYELK